MWRNVEKFLAILSWKPLFVDTFHWKTPRPIFVRFVTERPPFCHAICHRKTPTSEGLWHSYLTFICECPLGGGVEITDLYPDFYTEISDNGDDREWWTNKNCRLSINAWQVKWTNYEINRTPVYSSPLYCKFLLLFTKQQQTLVGWCQKEL